MILLKRKLVDVVIGMRPLLIRNGRERKHTLSTRGRLVRRRAPHLLRTVITLMVLKRIGALATLRPMWSRSIIDVGNAREQ